MIVFWKQNSILMLISNLILWTMQIVNSICYYISTFKKEGWLNGSLKLKKIINKWIKNEAVIFVVQVTIIFLDIKKNTF